jgi:hypothetical protein
VADGKVKIGMTKEMCKAAWGEPYSKRKVTTKDGEIETWIYGLTRKLTFLDQSLNTIEE